jgi:hypothetical protein
MRWLVAALLAFVASAQDSMGDPPQRSGAAPAREDTAAHAQFPNNGLVGLVPPPGMVASRDLPWFEAEDRALFARIFVSAAPASADEGAVHVASGLTEAGLAGRRARLVLREQISPTRLLVVASYVLTIASGAPQERTIEVEETNLVVREAGMIVVATAQIERGAAEHFPAGRIRASLESVVWRAPVPTEAKIEALRHTPPDDPLMTAQAVDHVVTMFEGSGDRDRTIVSRSGDWQREERERSGSRWTFYSNIATGVSIYLDHDDDGRISYLHARRFGARNVDQNYEHTGFKRTPTGQRETLLGETCEVWRAELDDPPPRDKGIVEGCLTADGVELWRRTLMPDGSSSSARRAVSVERRPVGAEARPPSSLFDLRRWAGRRPAPDARPNNEVRMTGSDVAAGLEGELILRRRDGWTYSEWPGRLIELSLDFGGPRFQYEIDSDGRLLSLSIHAGELRAPARAPPQNRTMRLLGEACQWFGIRGNSECRTHDGVILALRGWDGYHGSDWTATSVRRGGVSVEDMQPPAEAAAWLR